MDHVFTWLVEGSFKYYQNGLDDRPEIVNKAKEDYLYANDVVSNFINDNFKIKETVVTQELSTPEDYRKYPDIDSDEFKNMFKISTDKMNGYFYKFDKRGYGKVNTKQFKERMDKFGYSWKKIVGKDIHGENITFYGYEGLQYIGEEPELTEEVCLFINLDKNGEDIVEPVKPFETKEERELRLHYAQMSSEG